MRSGWDVVRLGEALLEAKPGFASGHDIDGGVFQFRMNNLTTDGRLDLSKRRRVAANEGKIDRYLLRPGDVLFNATNSPDLVGKSAYLDQLDEPAVFSNHFLRLRVDPERLEPRFLRHWIQTQWQRGLFRSRAKRWVNQATFGREALIQLELELPSIEEQRRIAAILDQADELRAKRQISLALLDSLNEAFFRDLFDVSRTPPITAAPSVAAHAAGWKWEMLTDVARLATGHTPDRKRPEFWHGGIPWVSLTEIRELDGRIAEGTELTVSEDGIRNSSAVVLPPGTVCFSRTASVGFVTVMGREMATSQDFVNWICGDRLDPMYLMIALRVARPHLRALSTGSTHKTIYMRVAEKLRVLVPPIQLQREFAAHARDVGRVAMHQKRSAVALDGLLASLQQRAFTGQL